MRQAQALRSAPLQPRSLQRLRRVCFRSKHLALTHLDHAGPHAVQVPREAGQKQQRCDEQTRVDTWIVNMKKVRKWVKQADAGDEAKDQLPLSAVDKVNEFRATLAKTWDPGRKSRGLKSSTNS